MTDFKTPDWSGVGAQKGQQNPNDPSNVGTYKDSVDSMTPEEKSVLVNFPKAPDPSPFGNMGNG